MKEKLILIRNFLYRLFLICFVINLITQLPLFFIKDVDFINISRMFGMSPFYVQQTIFSVVITARALIFYVILFPALALHWTIAKDKGLKYFKDSE